MEKADLFTDYLPIADELICWSFDWRMLQRLYDVEDYSVPVFRVLFGILEKLQVHPRSRIRRSDFVLYTGDFGCEYEFFGIAVPDSTPAAVRDILSSGFGDVEGYRRIECGNSGYDLPLIPVFRYQQGLVVAYTEEETLAGTAAPAGYGSGIRVTYRCAAYEDDCIRF